MATLQMKIALSVIVRVVGGGQFLRRCLSALVPQAAGRPIEVVVPYDSTISGIGELKANFPQVTFVDIGPILSTRAFTPGEAHELYDQRSAAGLAVARGEILAHLEDYAIPDASWCEQILLAHQQLGHGVMGGAVEHAGHGVLNWAVYFLDFGRYQLPLHEGPVEYLTDVNVSYKRAALESIRELWSGHYNEFTVHSALRRRGVVLWQRPQIVVQQDRGTLSFRHLIVERFYWGRLFAQIRAREIAVGSRLLYAIASPLIPPVMLARITKKVVSGGRNRARFLLIFPHVVVMTCFWCLGELVGYIRPVPCRADNQ